MKMVKSLLLGAAAGLVAVAGAQAADLPVKAKPAFDAKVYSSPVGGHYSHGILTLATTQLVVLDRAAIQKQAAGYIDSGTTLLTAEGCCLGQKIAGNLYPATEGWHIRTSTETSG